MLLTIVVVVVITTIAASAAITKGSIQQLSLPSKDRSSVPALQAATAADHQPPWGLVHYTKIFSTTLRDTHHSLALLSVPVLHRIASESSCRTCLWAFANRNCTSSLFRTVPYHICCTIDSPSTMISPPPAENARCYINTLPNAFTS